jgi:hypothetical protein
MSFIMHKIGLASPQQVLGHLAEKPVLRPGETTAAGLVAHK